MDSFRGATTLIQDVVYSDKKYYAIKEYIYWEPGQEEIVLDGGFTVEDLEVILDHVKHNQVSKSEV